VELALPTLVVVVVELIKVELLVLAVAAAVGLAQ
jgi:hypothetical protein